MVVKNKGREINLEIEYAQIIGDRERQEDALSIKTFSENGKISSCIAILCDGMGGYEEGDKLSQITCQLVAKQYDFKNKNTYFSNCIKKTNDVIKDYMAKNRIRKAGTTLVGVIVQDGEYVVVNVGDSSAFLLRDEKLVKLTEDENLDSRLKRQLSCGDISQGEYDANQRKEALTNYIGKKEMLDLQILKEMQGLEGDIIMLCSDGITKSLSEEEIKQILLDSVSLKQKAHILTVAAYDASLNQDNTTVLLISTKK